jgi:hypothetical protein
LKPEGAPLFSWIHLLELSDVTNKEQLKSYASFLDSLIENLGFIVDVVPAAVIAKENQKLQGDNNVKPPMARVFTQIDDFFVDRNATSPKAKAKGESERVLRSRTRFFRFGEAKPSIQVNKPRRLASGLFRLGISQ